MNLETFCLVLVPLNTTMNTITNTLLNYNQQLLNNHKNQYSP